MKRNNWGKALALALMASVTVSSASFAEAVSSPLEELNAILQNQKTIQEPSLLSKHLGTEALSQAVKEHGFEFLSEWGMQDGTAETFGLPQMLKDAFAEIGFMWSPTDKQWNLHLGGGLNEETALAANLYGDTAQLLLSCTPFYDGAIGIRSGSLYNQYIGSALEQLLVSLLDAPEIQELIPDIDLMFYPENLDLSAFEQPTDALKGKYASKIKELEESLLVEKEENAENTIYHVTCEMKEVLDIYQMFFTEFIALSLDMGAMTYEDAMETTEAILYFIEDAQEILGENILLDFQTKDNLLEKMSYRVSMTQEDYEKDEEGNWVPVPYTIDADVELAFADPTSPWNTFDVNVEITSTAMADEVISVWLTKQTENKENISETVISLMVKENEEVLYWGIPFTSSFDAAAGALDMNISLMEETEEIMNVTLDSHFEDVVTGESFIWTLDELSMSVEGETIGLNGNVRFSTDISGNYVPENTVMACEASQGEIFTVMSEIMMNGQEWLNKIENLNVF